MVSHAQRMNIRSVVEITTTLIYLQTIEERNDFFSGTKMKTMRWENKHANGITDSGYTEVMQYIAVFITKKNYYKWKK